MLFAILNPESKENGFVPVSDNFRIADNPVFGGHDRLAASAFPRITTPMVPGWPIALIEIVSQRMVNNDGPARR